jgi:hypothetical protein
MKKMWLEKIAFIYLIFLALIGTAVFGIIIHEYSHLSDFKKLNVTDEELCGLVLPTKWENWSYFINQPAGYYAFKINRSNLIDVKIYNEISKKTELKSYIISAFALIFFIICYWIIIFARYKEELKELEKDIYISQLESYIKR